MTVRYHNPFPHLAPAQQLLVAGLTALGLAMPGAALAQLQLTASNSGDSRFPALAADGSRVVFQSTANPDEDNSDGSDDIFAVDSNGSGLTQISQTLQGAIGGAISGNGEQIVFATNGDLAGDNPDGSVELFLANADGSSITQLTETDSASGIQQARIARDGNRIVFAASGNLSGDNPDGSLEVFVIDSSGGDPVQLSDGPPGSSAQFPAFSADGSQVVFSSNANPDGDNADGNTELFLAPADGSQSATQLTDTVTGQSLRASVSASGRILFESSANPTGGNSDGNVEMFVINSDGNGLTQLTSTLGGTNGFGRIAANNSRAVFQSNVDFTGENSDGSLEIFLIDTDTGDISQLTESGFASEQADISADGDQIVYQSAGNTAGENADGNIEIFLLNTDGSTPTGGNGDGDDDSGRSGEFGCFFAGSGCSLCEDEEGSSDDSADDSANTDDDGLAFDGARNRVVRADPTLGLLVIAGVAGVFRRRR